MTALLLADKSVMARRELDDLELGDDDEVCLCAVTRMEVLYSARSRGEYETIQADLARYRDLRMDAATFAAATAAQRELATSGEHRVPIADLLIASCAQQHGADLLHVDRHFDLLATVLRFRPVRV